MKKIIAIFVVLFAVAACDRADKPMVCGDYEVLIESIDDMAMRVVISSDPVNLKRTESEFGARYAGVLNDVDVVLFDRGNGWTLVLGGSEVITCVK